MKNVNDLPSIIYQGHKVYVKEGLLFYSIYNSKGECVECFHKITPLSIITVIIFDLMIITLGGLI